MSTPTHINQLTEQGCLEIVWADRTVRFPFRFVREQCPCAQCVHEITGERILDPASIPADLSVRDLQLVGNYALKIVWSDGHDSGLFTWETLARMRPPAPDGAPSG